MGDSPGITRPLETIRKRRCAGTVALWSAQLWAASGPNDHRQGSHDTYFDMRPERHLRARPTAVTGGISGRAVWDARARDPRAQIGSSVFIEAHRRTIYVKSRGLVF